MFQRTRREFLGAGAAAGAALLLPRTSLGSASSTAKITVLLDEPIAAISPFVYGHFIEELGTVIYDGVWVGESSTVANRSGIRTAVIDALRQIKAPLIRWPGGCFADSYDWRDGIGPREKRPRRTSFWVDSPESRGLPPNSVQKSNPNQFGTDEFMKLCRMTGAEPYLAANLRSLPPLNFDQWVEYCNAPTGSTTLADERAANGSPEPYGVRFWGVGNESWGCGGTLTPDEYAGLYRRFSSWEPHYGLPLRLVASGPNGADYDWTAVFFERILGSRPIRPPFGWALHFYADMPPAAGATEDDIYAGYAVANRMEEILLGHWSAMGVNDPAHRTRLVIDEYGPWYHAEQVPATAALGRPQVTMRDALITALTLDIFNRHADKVGAATCAQLINCLDSLLLSHTDQFVTTPVFSVFNLYKDHQGARAVRVEFPGTNGISFSPSAAWDAPELRVFPSHATQSLWGLNGSASLAGNRLTITAVNLHLHEDCPAEIDLRHAGKPISAQAFVLGGAEGVAAMNSFEAPGAVAVQTSATVEVHGSKLRFTFPKSSVTKLSVTLQ